MNRLTGTEAFGSAAAWIDRFLAHSSNERCSPEGQLKAFGRQACGSAMPSLHPLGPGEGGQGLLCTPPSSSSSSPPCAPEAPASLSGSWYQGASTSRWRPWALWPSRHHGDPRWPTAPPRVWFVLSHSLPQVPTQLSGFTKGPADLHLLLIWHLRKWWPLQGPKAGKEQGRVAVPGSSTGLPQPDWASEPLNLTVPALAERELGGQPRTEMGPFQQVQSKDLGSGELSPGPHLM